MTVTIADQLFGIPVESVRSVLGEQRITRIPLAPREVAGALNLRGRIVTAIDLRKRLNLPPRPDDSPGMNVVVEHQGEPYSLIVDNVGEVLSIPADRIERNPATLNPIWRDVSEGIYLLDGALLIILGVDRLLDIADAKAA